ncbi:hypothetical protein DL738_11980 [Escherichia coli]|nr:hypothetical protein [Salmonella enterica]EGE2353563.1 hypothetical protein [Escherichia coli]EHS0389536.1 hypothetical protein [Salmonella enterica]EIV1877183.1 hypothetical protein [Salmonella enterica]
MNKLDIVSSQLDLISLLNAAGYSASDVVFKRHCALNDFNASFWMFVAEQKDRYIEVSCILSHPNAEGAQHVDVRIVMFEDPIDDEISRTLDTNTYATSYKYVERIPFTETVQNNFTTSLAVIITD